MSPVFAKSLAAVGLAAATLIAAQSAQAAQPAPDRNVGFGVNGHGMTLPRESKAGWRGRSTTLGSTNLNLSNLAKQAAGGATIPFWTSSITSPLNGKTYTTSMVGSSPFAATKTNTVITYVPIIARIHFSNGVVLDPTVPTACDTQPVSSRFYASPIFVPTDVVSNGVDVSTGVTGGTQLISAFQRGNYWSYVSGSQYGVTLKASTTTPIVVDVTAPRGSTVSNVASTCGSSGSNLGKIDINSYDSIVNSLIAKYSTPTQLPIILTYNLVLTSSGQCCIIGYHNAVSTSAGTRTYAVGSWVDSGIFTGLDDVSVWAHELGEWMDDPFVQARVSGGGNDDVTPAWGNIGQVSGCQTNLEVGDPLTGTSFAITGTGGFTYHTQDLAYHDWFYRTAASGTGGKYSFLGVFTTTQGACA